MRTLAILTDPVYTKVPAPSLLHRWLSRFVQDERDMPFVYLLLQLTALGESLLPLIKSFGFWGDTHLDQLRRVITQGMHPTAERAGTPD